MDFYDFISQEEIDKLPLDASDAFIEFVVKAKRRLLKNIAGLDDENPDEYEYMRISKFNFVNCVSEIATYLGVPVPNADLERNFSGFSDADFKKFSSDVERFIARLAFKKSERMKSDTIAISFDAKSKIRSYISHIKDLIDKSDIINSEKDNLFKRLSKFEDELNRNRLSILEIGRLVIEIAVLPGAVAATTDLISPMINKITLVIAQEMSQPENQMPRMAGSNIFLPPKERQNEKKAEDENPF